MRDPAKKKPANLMTAAACFILLFAGLVFGEDKPEIYVQVGHIFTANAVAFSPDGHSAVAGGDDQTLKLWDTARGEEIKRFSGHRGLVSAVSFSPDGHSILSGSWDQTLKLWDADTGQVIRSFSGHTGFVSAVAISPDGRYALSGSYDKTLKLWDLDTGQEIRAFNGHTDYVTTVAFSPDSRFILSGSRDKTLILWHVETGEDLKTFVGHANHVNCAAFSPDGFQAVSASSDYTLKLWNVKTGTELKTFKGHAQMVTSVSFSRDGQSLLSTGREGAVKLWDVKSGKCTMTFKGKSDWIRAAAWSPDGRNALSGGKKLILWDTAAGREIRTFTGQPAPPDAALFFPYQRYVSAANVYSINKLLDVSSGRDLAVKISFTGGEWINMTPDGYFDASPAGAKSLGVRVADHTHGIDQFSNSFYRPEMVKLAMAGKELFEPEEDFLQIALDKPAPAIDILSPPAGSTVDGNRVGIDVRITDNRGGIGNVYVYLNGVQVAGERLSSVPTGEKKERQFRFSVPVVPGDNNISATAFNSDGTMASLPASLSVRSNAAGEAPRVHALIVGINQYGNELLSLKYAAADAAAFAETLKRSTAPLFGEGDIILLTSAEETSKDRIKKNFDILKNGMRPNDLFVFYMASHGLLDTTEEGQQYYLLTGNMRFFSSPQIGKQALNLEELMALVGSVPVQNKFVILDTCHAAYDANAITIERLKRNNGFAESTAIKRFQRTAGITVFSSLSDMRLAFRSNNHHGLFTSVLNKGLQADAAADRDGVITVNSLAKYLQIEMKRLSKDTLKKEYVPVTQIGTNFPVSKIKK